MTEIIAVRALVGVEHGADGEPRCLKREDAGSDREVVLHQVFVAEASQDFSIVNQLIESLVELAAVEDRKVCVVC